MSFFFKQQSIINLPSIEENNTKLDTLSQNGFNYDMDRLNGRSVTNLQKNSHVQLPSIYEFESVMPSHAPVCLQNTTFRTAKEITPTLEAQVTTPKRCESCQSSQTPEWRKGPSGPRTLCNACGLIWTKLYKQEKNKNIKKQKLCNQNTKNSSSTTKSNKPTLSFLLS